MGILQRFWRTLRFIGAYTVANVQAAMEYRISFLMQILTMAVNDGLWLFFWWTYFHQYPLVHGWQATDVVVIWAVSAGGYGLCMGIFGNSRELALLVMNGGLDAYLGMPRSILLHVCVSASDPTAWGDLLFAFGSFLLFLHPDVLHIALFIVLICMSACIFGAFCIIFCSLAFFVGNTDGLTQQLLNALITFSTYPMNLFSGAVRLMLFTVVPAGFISFIPLQLLHQFTIPLLGGMIGFTVFIVALAVGLFHLGLRRYESGNLIGMQM